ncbi:MAG: hypothetical protein JWQ71_130 [Pedosphaera sp.]|nr:hypothetical protein [Pedosphaera sp.]
MKTIIVIFLAAGLGFAAAYGFVSHQKDAQLKKQQALWQAEKDQLESAAAQKKPARVETVTVHDAAAPTQGRATPQEILDKLIKLKPGSGAEHIHTVREIVHQLENLAEAGPDALPVIKEFLARNEDVNYSSVDENGDQRNSDPRSRKSRRGSAKLEFTFPPSLRIGLFDVLQQIAGGGAEKILSDTLGTTGRAVEVAYLANVLEALSPGKYRDIAITAAKDLLTHPPEIANPDRLDQSAEEYLFGVLEKFGDTSFAAIAQTMLVKPDGQLDRAALKYLDNEQSVPALYQAYKDGRITNQWDKVNLASKVLNYAGQNQQANALLNEVVTNTNIDSRMRSFAVVRLAGGDFGPMTTESPTDPQVIKSRLDLVTQLMKDETLQNSGDDRMLRSMATTALNLQNLLDGKPLENPQGGRGNRGNRSGNNNNGGGQQTGTQSVPAN